MRNRPRKPFKQNPIVTSLSSCTTILRTPVRTALSSLLAFSLVACNPAGTTHGPTTINQYGGDKNDPGGYEGTGGTGDGGGGQGIICTEETKNPALKSKLLVRDIFEAIHNSKLTIKELKSSSSDPMEVSDEAIELLIASLKTYFGPATPNLEIGNKLFWREFIKNISFISEDASLYPSQDANSPIALPAGCKIAQIAFWDDSNGQNDVGTLYVDKKQWQKLDQINKIALLAHEYYFKQARHAGFKNSDSVRAKVGRLFSTEGIDPLFKNWVPSTYPIAREILPEVNIGFKFCKGVSVDDPKAELHMYQYEGKDNQQHFVFPLITATSISINPLMNQEFTLKNMSKDLIAATNLLVLGGQELENIRNETTDYFANRTQLKFASSGILEFPGRPLGMHEDEPSQSPRLVTYLNYLEDSSKSEIWSDSLRTNQGYVKVVILNPAMDLKPKKLSAHDLMVVVQNTFVKKLKAFVPTTRWANAQPDLILLITQLHEEINEAKLKTGAFTFEKFNKKFKDFVDKHTGAGPDDAMGDETSPHNDETEGLTEATQQFGPTDEDVYILRDELPSLMLKASMNLIGEDEIKKSFRSYSEISKENLQSYPKGHVSISSNGNQVNFTMTCKDADQIYSDKIDAISKLLNSKDDVDRKSPVQAVAAARLKPHTEKEKQSAIDTFLKFLIDGALAQNQIEILMCEGEEKKVDECVLRDRLFRASKIYYESCTARNNIDTWNNGYRLQTCMLVTFPEDSSRYLVWGEIEDSFSTLVAAKQISPVPSFKSEK